MSALEDLLLQCFASVADREKAAAYIEAAPERFRELFDLACSPKDSRAHLVAAWVLEKYSLHRLEVLDDQLDTFLKGVAVQKHESKRRPMMKLLYHYCRKKECRAQLSKKQIDGIVAACFDYMLEAEKAAALAFAMKTLHFFRQHEDWIEEELQAYIAQRLPNSSAGFRSVVRQISWHYFSVYPRSLIFALYFFDMKLTALNAISPIDGRYRSKTKTLAAFFSEEALIKYRVRVEIEYFIALCELPLPQLESFNPSLFEELRSIYQHFTEEDAKEVKEIEKTTNHDVKAVEYFIKKEFDRLELQEYKEFIHFGLTSQDINNTSIPLSVKEAVEKVYLPSLDEVLEQLAALAEEYKEVPLLARTHGQPASPTRLGKEIEVFVQRIKEQRNALLQVPHAAKFGGATGNFNAHKVAYPKNDWKAFGQDFVENRLGLHHSFPTTQIEHYDHFAGLCDAMKRINTIFIDLDRDLWTYISMDYFKQKIKAGEVGSSAMPHKVNPIDFENSEGNLGIANALFGYLAEKLPVSRLQRDLTDSTVLRNIGTPFGHSLIGFQSTLKGLGKLLLNEEKIREDLENNWAVVAEAVQTILRREGYTNPYEALKELTRTNEAVTQASMHAFIDQLDIDSKVKAELKTINPFNYTGI